jgi:hypothetical protein
MISPPFFSEVCEFFCPVYVLIHMYCLACVREREKRNRNRCFYSVLLFDLGFRKYFSEHIFWRTLFLI